MALDLFCGAGGASMGLHCAGFDVVGVDINLKRGKRYPFQFICGDALRPPVDLGAFDFIWASPPCQHYTAVFNGRDHLRAKYPDHVGAMRDLLTAAGVPFVIENVPGAPISPDVVLTGAQFGLDIVRRRNFEVHGWAAPFALQSRHMGKTVTNGGLACVAGAGANKAWNVRRKAEKRLGKATKWRDLPADLKRRLTTRNCVAGWREAMGIDWMTRDEIREAVPPAYAEFIGRAALEALT